MELTYSSLPRMFFAKVAEDPSRALVRHKVGDQWRPLTRRQMAAAVREAARGLMVLGAREQEKIALLSENRPEWFIADLACQSVRCPDSPIYATNIPEQVAHVLIDSDCNFAFVSDAEQLAKVLIAEKNHRRLNKIIVFEDDAVPPDDDHIISLDELRHLGNKEGDEAELDSRIESVQPDDLATLIYTSGTTGNPKGVMLTHYNILYDIEASLKMFGKAFNDHEEHLSFLPLSHSLERTLGYYAMIYIGATINFAESIPKVRDNMAEVRPTIGTAVPRICEKMYAGVLERRNNASPTAQKLIDWSLDIGNRYISYLEKRHTPPLAVRAQYKVARKILFDKVHQGLGGRIKFLGTGGAPLAPHIGRFMWAAGVELYIGYGLTETAPLATFTPLGEVNVDNVGLPVEGVEIRIADDGEVLIRGPIVMRGYHNLPDHTAEAIDSEGWFHSGDVGQFDKNGYLHITDRKKDLIITAGGKNIAPQNIEGKLKLQRLIDQVCVIGDNRPYLTALIVPDFEVLTKIAADKGWDKSPKALAADPQVHELVAEEVGQVNRELARYETIKKFKLLDTPFSEENKMLTPSLKVRRKIVFDHYRMEIENLYGG